LIDRTLENVFGDIDRKINIDTIFTHSHSGPGAVRAYGMERQSVSKTNNYYVTINADTVDSFQKVVKVFYNLENAMIAEVGVN
jgi:hypothetical protein